MHPDEQPTLRNAYKEASELITRDLYVHHGEFYLTITSGTVKFDDLYIWSQDPLKPYIADFIVLQFLGEDIAEISANHVTEETEKALRGIRRASKMVKKTTLFRDELHPNSVKLLELEREANELSWNKKNPDKKDFSYEVAKKADELGEDHPSDRAIKIAEEIISKLKKESD